ncbi:cystatin-like fold lipoprotein [Salicibibacter cibarius]|uniref:Cystatin-like fold lipoprotein n=1 Tax=Salicibibacter cibarius TaxID=2743000 RepID=A0A7T6Z2C0_9BACI|nr:cystatin-like fold lipoprotein [Salicibibacter cibarius]QQK75402.1 cystatin-like fold lipoprotein [Salicibibacter cibarius]
MKKKVGMMLISLLMLTACGSGYDDVIDQAVEELQEGPLGESHDDVDVRERSDISVWDDGRYVSIHYYKPNGSNREYFYEVSGDDFNMIGENESNQVRTETPDYQEQFGEEI